MLCSLRSLNMVLLILGGLITSCFGDDLLRHHAEHRLVDLLFSDYDVGSRPVLNAADAINVNISVALIQIMDLVEKNQTLITQLWIYEEWIDETLNWNPEDFKGLDSIIVPSAMLWLPDMFIFNNANSGDEGYITLNDSRVLIQSDGLVQWVVPLIIQSTCTVDVTYFPFDSQVCKIFIGSWIYEEVQVNLSLKNSVVDLSFYSQNTELDLLEATLERNASNRKSPQSIIRLFIRRKPLYYTYTIISPTLVLCILNLFSFLLPCDNGDKVGIGLTVFLSLYVLQLAVAENIPESNSLPLIGLFLTLVMTLNAISLVCATVVINVKKKGDLACCPYVPDSVLNFCRNVLARIVCTTFVNYDDYYGCCDQHQQQQQQPVDSVRVMTSADRRDAYFPDHNNTERNSSEMIGTHRIIGDAFRDVDTDCRNGDEADSSRKFKPVLRRTWSKTQPSKVRKEPTGRPPGTAQSRDQRHMMRDPRHEWYFVAEILDKTLFLVFLLTMLITVVVSLVVVPLVQE